MWVITDDNLLFCRKRYDRQIDTLDDIDCNTIMYYVHEHKCPQQAAYSLASSQQEEEEVHKEEVRL